MPYATSLHLVHNHAGLQRIFDAVPQFIDRLHVSKKSHKTAEKAHCLYVAGRALLDNAGHYIIQSPHTLFNALGLVFIISAGIFTDTDINRYAQIRPYRVPIIGGRCIGLSLILCSPISTCVCDTYCFVWFPLCVFVCDIMIVCVSGCNCVFVCYTV